MKPIHVVLIVAGEIVLALLAYGAGAGTGYFAGLGQAGGAGGVESYDVEPERTLRVVAEDHRFGVSGPVLAGALTEILIENRDDTYHTFTYSVAGETFDHGLPASSTSRVLVRFAEAGEIAFHCKPHDGMRGALVVEAA